MSYHGESDGISYAPLHTEENRTPYGSHSPALMRAGDSEALTVKAKYRKRYVQFRVPVSSALPELTATIKEKFQIEYEGGASVGTAYLLWLIFGFIGVHRFYLRQHNAASFVLWLLTFQLFGLGWLYDGLVLISNVRMYNKRLLDPVKRVPEGGFFQFVFGFKDHEKPNMVGAYLLWFFFGFAGAHRWYTGYHSASSFTAWICTYQMFGLGWLYDAYYTAHMVNHPKTPSTTMPFFIKVHNAEDDYLPVNTSEDLAHALKAIYASDKVVRLIVTPKKSEAITYILWFFFGWLGAHAWYLELDSDTYIPRLCTANYFGIGYIVEGINLDNLIEEANQKLAGEFVPSHAGRRHWPLTGIIIEGGL